MNIAPMYALSVKIEKQMYVIQDQEKQLGEFIENMKSARDYGEREYFHLFALRHKEYLEEDCDELAKMIERMPFGMNRSNMAEWLVECLKDHKYLYESMLQIEL